MTILAFMENNFSSLEDGLDLEKSGHRSIRKLIDLTNTLIICWEVRNTHIKHIQLQFWSTDSLQSILISLFSKELYKVNITSSSSSHIL